MKKIYLLLFCISFAFAEPIDATLEVVKKFGNLPNILVQNTGKDYSQREYSQRIFKMLIADLKVTGHFATQESPEVVSSAMVLNFDEYRKSYKPIKQILEESSKHEEVKEIVAN